MRGPAARRCRARRDVAAEHHDRALLQPLRSGDQRQQRRLADAVGADDADHDARWDVERDAVERDDLAVAMRDVLDRDDRLGMSRLAASATAAWRRMRRRSAGGHSEPRTAAARRAVAAHQVLAATPATSRGVVHLDVADAAHAGLDPLDVVRRPAPCGTWILTRNISFSRSLFVSTSFGVNCASGDTKLT